MQYCKAIFFTSLLSAIIFLSFSSEKKSFFKKQKTQEESGELKTTAEYLKQAIALGDKSGFSKDELKMYGRVQLLHLFTPSGLHLGMLVKTWRILIAWIIPYSFRPWVELILVFSFWHKIPEAWMAFRRMVFILVIFTFCRILFKRYPKFRYEIFLFALLLDFVGGTFQENPLSFLASVIFLSLFFCASNLDFWKMSAFLLWAQCLLSGFFNQEIFPLFQLVGLSLTSLIIPFLPLILMSSWFSFGPMEKIVEKFVFFVLEMTHVCVLWVHAHISWWHLKISWERWVLISAFFAYILMAIMLIVNFKKKL